MTERDAGSVVIPFPDRKYNIIYADPPWSYQDKANAGKRGAVYKYPTQNAAWIRSLPVNDLAGGGRRAVSLGHHATTAAGHRGDDSVGLSVSD